MCNVLLNRRTKQKGIKTDAEFTDDERSFLISHGHATSSSNQARVGSRISIETSYLHAVDTGALLENGSKWSESEETVSFIEYRWLVCLRVKHLLISPSLMNMI